MLFSLWPCRKWFIHFVQRGDLKRVKNKTVIKRNKKRKSTKLQHFLSNYLQNNLKRG